MTEVKVQNHERDYNPDQDQDRDEGGWYILYQNSNIYLCKGYSGNNGYGKRVYNCNDKRYEEEEFVFMGSYGFSHNDNNLFHEKIHDEELGRIITKLQEDKSNQNHINALTGILTSCYPKYFERYQETKSEKQNLHLVLSDHGVFLCKKESNRSDESTDSNDSDEYKSIFDCTEKRYTSWETFRERQLDPLDQITDTTVLKLINTLIEFYHTKYEDRYRDILCAILKTEYPKYFKYYEERLERTAEEERKFRERRYSELYGS